MSKFTDSYAESLYGETPDDSTGSSSEGSAWYGLYTVERTILIERQDGIVTAIEFDSTDELMAAWEETVSDVTEFEAV